MGVASSTDYVFFLCWGLVFSIAFPVIFHTRLKRPILTAVCLYLIWFLIAGPYSSFLILILAGIVKRILAFALILVNINLDGLDIAMAWYFLLAATLLGTTLALPLVKFQWISTQKVRFSAIATALLLLSPLIVSVLIYPVFNPELADGIEPSRDMYINFLISTLPWQAIFLTRFYFIRKRADAAPEVTNQPTTGVLTAASPQVQKQDIID